MSSGSKKRKKTGTPAFHCAEDIGIAAENTHQIDKVMANPETADIGIGGTQASTPKQLAEKARVEDFHSSLERTFIGTSEHVSLRPFNEHKPALPQLTQPVQDSIAHAVLEKTPRMRSAGRGYCRFITHGFELSVRAAYWGCG
jgi:hypothetical protein